jgi:spermidine synthase
MYTVPKMGFHLMLEFTNVSAVDLNNFAELDSFLSTCIKTCGATIESQQHKNFEPQGVTILYLLSESHFSIHTWPENKSCAIDFYHCGGSAKDNLTQAEIILCDKLGWENCTGSILLERGGTSQALLNHYDHSSTLFKGVKLLHREQTKYQDLRVYDTKEMGRCLSLDFMIQISDTLEDNYTVDLSRLVVEKDKSYNHILIIGAGDMIIPTYILDKFPGVKKVTVVEIDDRVVENTRKFFKFCDSIDKYVQDGKLEIVIEDGAKYLRDKITEKYQYDGLIIDNSDVYIFDGPAASLFTPEFYSNIIGVLRSGAAFSQQVSDENVKKKWEDMARSVGFTDFNYIYSNTPEYSVALPLGIARKS